MRVAIVGSGPAGFYFAEHLFKKDVGASIDMFDRLVAPFGLVRFGVAPDHQKIKRVTKVFERIASREDFRYFGHVEFGKDITLDDLKKHYHAVCFATGAQTDKRLGIPGEDLAGSHPATEFVAWYNAHPDFEDRSFNLDAERVAIIGVGNVAVDVARVLCRTDAELRQTDIADHALAALEKSKVREVIMIGRRGPAQAAFTNPEVRELGELEGADVAVVPEEIALDPLSKSLLEKNPDKDTQKKLEILQGFVDRPGSDKPRTLTLRFLVSPTELLGDDEGNVRAIKLVKNKLTLSGDRLRAEATDEFEEIPVQLVFRSVGYRGVSLSGVPFREDWGTVPNEQGRVTDAPKGKPVTGLYVAGWIKRGPSGVIGTNKPDAGETVDRLIEDREAGTLWTPSEDDPLAVDRLLVSRGVRWVSFEQWQRIDAHETESGESQGRPRVKLVRAEQMLDLLD